MLIPLNDPSESKDWFLQLDEAISEDQIKLILELEDNLKQSETIGHFDNQSRTSSNTFVPIGEKYSNLYNHIKFIIKNVNEKYFRYSLNGLELLQYARYSKGEQYVMHTDSGLKGDNNTNRKLSFSILLSDENSFTGGELQLYTYNFPKTVNLKKGSIVFFPSFLPHSVTPVEEGIRESLVGWVCGPDFI